MWNNVFSAPAQCLITQHSIHSGLSNVDVALAQWSVYTTIHKDHRLNFAIFLPILDTLINPLQTMTLSEEDTKMFWESTRKLLPSCFSIIRKVRRKCANEKTAFKQLLDVLKILSKVSNLEPPPELDLFPPSLYGWLDCYEERSKCNVKATAVAAVMQGANDWFDYILEKSPKEDDTDEGMMLYLVKVIQLVRIDLQKAVEYYDKMFQE